MSLLFAISIVCLLALTGAAVALAQRIHSGPKLSQEPSRGQRDFMQHLFNAAEEEDLLVPRIVLRQTVQDVAARKSWNQRPEVVTIRPAAVRLNLEETAGQAFQGQRKSPQPVHKSGMERLDWAYFNKDMGDLTDPYGTSRIRANFRTSPRRS